MWYFSLGAWTKSMRNRSWILHLMNHSWILHSMAELAWMTRCRSRWNGKRTTSWLAVGRLPTDALLQGSCPSCFLFWHHTFPWFSSLTLSGFISALLPLAAQRTLPNAQHQGSRGGSSPRQLSSNAGTSQATNAPQSMAFQQSSTSSLVSSLNPQPSAYLLATS